MINRTPVSDRVNGHRRFLCLHESLARHAVNKKCEITYGRLNKPSFRSLPRLALDMLRQSHTGHSLIHRVKLRRSFDEMLGPPSLARRPPLC
jgi:hypothetical protein